MNSNLTKAKKVKDDEFYTQIADIENEMKHYRKHFKRQTIFMNCDDPEWSNFWKFFVNNFHLLGIKKLISTHYEASIPSYKLEYDGVETIKTTLKQNGDFRSPEAIELLKEADIVITNPPFSLFREYVAQLMAYNKKFLIIGNKSAVSCKEIFPLIKDNKMWLGVNSPQKFGRPNGEITSKVSGLCRWFTNLEHNKRNEEIFLFRSYNDPKMEYPTYENYKAINVAKVVDIPKDYDGEMGVPITFLDKYNPNQFEIIGADGDVAKTDVSVHRQRFVLNGKAKFARILIKRR